MTDNNHIQALGLLSGGLDSQLAVRVIQQQGIRVKTIVFDHPFYDITSAVKAAASLKVPLRIFDFTDDMIELLHSPPHGFGRCMNPCIDCHARMLRRAGELLEEEDCRFLFTGEVLNERPMSQTRRALRTVAAESEVADLVLRPLSAQELPETRPEREGWVDRARLLKFNGRRRTPQFELAREFGLISYPSPAGGCLLTEPTFCFRLKELKQHEGLKDRDALRRLRAGRHLRLEAGPKFVLGRDEKDNQFLEATVTRDDSILTLEEGRMGPTGLLPADATEAALQEAAAITAFYGKCPPAEPARIIIRHSGEPPQTVITLPMPASEIEKRRINF